MAQNPDGGGYEIRTREAVTPTRFPSVRHRPLGESSMVFSMQTHLQAQDVTITQHGDSAKCESGTASLNLMATAHPAARIVVGRGSENNHIAGVVYVKMEP